MIITISREYGAGGHSIGQAVAKELGIEFYDRDIIKAAVKESGLEMPEVEKVEEEITRTGIFLRMIAPAAYVDQQDNIRAVIAKIAECLKFDNCPSHTELKINERGIFVIETSPRLGGDYITSVLTPLSTGVNMEDQLLCIALGLPVNTEHCVKQASSGVCFISLPQGKIKEIDHSIDTVPTWSGIHDFEFKLSVGNFFTCHIKYCDL